MATTSTPVRVPFLDLKAQYHSIKPEIDAAVAKILEAATESMRHRGRPVDLPVPALK